MGTGSSRTRKTRRSWSSSSGGGGGSSSSSSVPVYGDSPEPRRSPASALQESDSDSELLDAVLAEFREEKLPPLSRPAPPPPPSRGRGQGDGLHLDPQILLMEFTTESNNFANQLPLKKPDLQAPISYDYSEEELMATIEQEYCR